MKADGTHPLTIIPAQYQWAMMTGKTKLRNIISDRYPHIKPKSLKDYIAQSNKPAFELVLTQ
jgi:hypothetical protein